MCSIKEEKISKEITGKYSCSFIFPEDGLYLIEIIASAKSWWQNFKSSRSFFKDDDIFLYLDNKELTTSKNEKKDARSAWDGNELKGLERTVLIAAYLTKGKHVIDLKSDQSPYLKSISISKIKEKDKIIYTPKNNNLVQKSEGRPWLSYIILDLFITKLSITAQTNKNRKDDDDLKLIINGEIQKNKNKHSHRDWYWCGKILKGENKTFSKDINSQVKQFNLDLYSDETPLLSKIEIGIKEPKRIPTVDNPLWTGNFKDDTEEMILARAIFGEGRSLPDEGKIAIAWSIRNRVDDKRWPDNYHDVILQKSQYSAFRKIDPNWEYVINPFYKINSKQLAAWKRCYEIAGLVMSGKIKDPTGGVNHYFSDYIDYPSWTKSKNAKFIMKIGNTLFYNLKKENNSGFVRIKYLVAVLLLAVAIFAGYFFISRQHVIGDNSPYNELEKKYYHFYINPQTSEIEKIIFKANGQVAGIKQITNDGYAKSHLFLYANNGSAFGYYQDLHKQNEDYDDNNNEERERYYNNFYALMINRNDGSAPFMVYKGDYHTSNWEWENIDHVKVYNNCGTCCRYYYLININTKKIEEEGHLETEEDACIKMR